MMYPHINILHVFLLLHGLAKHLNRKPNEACQGVLYMNVLASLTHLQICKTLGNMVKQHENLH